MWGDPSAAPRAELSPSPAMLGTLMTALFFVVRAVRQVSLSPGTFIAALLFSPAL